MISLICQKTNNGIIRADDKELLNEALCDNNEDKTRFSRPRISTVDNESVNSDYSQNLKKISSNTKNSSKNVSYAKSPPSSKFSMIKSIDSSPPSSAMSIDVNSPIVSACEKPSRFSISLEKRRISSRKLIQYQQQFEKKMNKPVPKGSCYDKINKILEDHKEVQKVIETDLENTKETKLRKQELLYKNWYLNVYEPIQSGIQNKMQSSKADYARNIRNLRYLEYLHQVNKLGGVYQDDFEPNEYDPMNLINLDANMTHRLKDPTNLAQRKRNKEERMILKWVTGRDFSYKETEKTKLPIILNDNETRADLDWNYWLLDQYNTIESTVREKSAKKCNPNRYNSEFNLNWNRDLNLNTFVSSNNSVYKDFTKQNLTILPKAQKV